MPDANAPYALVVDDETFIRMDACAILEDAGFNCLDARDCEEGLRLLERHAGQVTLLFTDVETGGEMDGFELAQICGQRWPHVGILVASGVGRPAPGQIPENAVFIRKPFSAKVVQERVNELLPEGQKPEPLRMMAQLSASQKA